MISEEMLSRLQDEGYTNLKQIKGKGICGLHRFIFTTGLCYGINTLNYEGRYCYDSFSDALSALNEWDGESDPKDELWIKHKGDIEYPNPIKERQ